MPSPAASTSFSAFAWNFSSLLNFRFLAGIGVGGEWGAGIVLFNEVWRSHGRGFGSALVQAMSSAGTIIAAFVATLCLTYLSADQSWRAALLFGGLPMFLTIFVRAKMPESRLWTEYDRLRKLGALPADKASEQASILEIFRGASLRYFIFGTLMCGAYIISFQAISIYMPTLMIRDLHANPGVVLIVTVSWSCFSATGLLLTGAASDRFGRKTSVVATTLICIFGYGMLYLFGRADYPGSIFFWPLFWCYALWALGQGSIGMFGPWYSELFPVELRSTGASAAFNVGRLIGGAMPYVVPLIAAELHDLFKAMMFGVVGATFSLLFALFLPETVGRKFAVIEGKEYG